ncbi:MAG: TatD family hydrolase [Bacteriovoracaceae bacterium]|nr:TatD family hydrolase [Bacteriovoracaceae bacterium]
MSWFDFHTHQENKENSIYNLTINENDNTSPPDSSPFSIGLHPWFQLNDTIFNKVKMISKLKNCVAVGETGLDKVRDENFELQVIYLKKHFELAEEIEKPVILHCVKAYNDILKIALDMKLTVPVIFHDYNGGEEITIRLIKESNFYFSLGRLFMSKSSKVRQSVSHIPINRVCFETDDKKIDLDLLGETLSNIKFLTKQKIEEEQGKTFYRLFK